MHPELYVAVLGSLGIAAVTALTAFTWKMGRDMATVQTALQGMDRRFEDHAEFIKMILDRVLPEKG